MGAGEVDVGVGEAADVEEEEASHHSSTNINVQIYTATEEVETVEGTKEVAARNKIFKVAQDFKDMNLQ